MITVQEYIDTRAPQYSSDTRLPEMEAQAAMEIGCVFGDLANKATFLLIMHWLTLDDRDADTGGQGIGGTIKRNKEGQLEREFMVDFSLTAKYPDLSQTRWGMELIRLRRSVVMTVRNRFTPPCR